MRTDYINKIILFQIKSLIKVSINIRLDKKVSQSTDPNDFLYIIDERDLERIKQIESIDEKNSQSVRTGRSFPVGHCSRSSAEVFMFGAGL